MSIELLYCKINSTKLKHQSEYMNMFMLFTEKSLKFTLICFGSWFPVFRTNYRQTNLTLLIYIWMVNSCLKCDLQKKLNKNWYACEYSLSASDSTLKFDCLFSLMWELGWQIIKIMVIKYSEDTKKVSVIFVIFACTQIVLRFSHSDRFGIIRLAFSHALNLLQVTSCFTPRE